MRAVRLALRDLMEQAVASEFAAAAKPDGTLAFRIAAAHICRIERNGKSVLSERRQLQTRHAEIPFRRADGCGKVDGNVAFRVVKHRKRRQVGRKSIQRLRKAHAPVRKGEIVCISVDVQADLFSAAVDGAL